MAEAAEFLLMGVSFIAAALVAVAFVAAAVSFGVRVGSAAAYEFLRLDSVARYSASRRRDG